MTAPPTYHRGPVQTVIMWALALSWAPLWIVALIAAWRDHDRVALFVGALSCCWIMALAEMFGVLDRPSRRKPE